MLFVEGNHFCPSCEKSGHCLLQATAYEMGMEGPHFEEFYPDRPVDASHPDILLDFNRCILCELCVRASRDVDGKNVFAIGGHGIGTRTCWSTAPAASWRHRHGAGRPRRQHLPGGRDPAQAARLRVPIGERRFDATPVSEPVRGGR
jgi:[NiFe] hydrogenase diaphorase moiety small subunit